MWACGFRVFGVGRNAHQALKIEMRESEDLLGELGEIGFAYTGLGFFAAEMDFDEDG